MDGVEGMRNGRVVALVPAAITLTVLLSGWAWSVFYNRSGTGNGL
jgi:hypothetical protein